MSRLVIVSNRVADPLRATLSGGLAVVVCEALRSRDALWVGWNGKTTKRSGRKPSVEQGEGFATVTFPLTETEFENYYNGFSNSVLWPVFHYRLDLVRYRKSYLTGYGRVNSRFADNLAPLLRPDDVIWIHDYHLIPLAAELRKRGHGHRIGFFLHIPFPPPEMLEATPAHDWLMRALFSCDLIGFQSRTDLGNFSSYVRDVLGGKVSGSAHYAFGRTVRADVFPVGIDADAFVRMAASPESAALVERTRQHLMGQTQIIGVDRLDYSKGLPERFRAFQRLLELYPHNGRSVAMLQIAQPTREDVDAYADIRDELEGLMGKINGRFGELDWTPLRYIHRSVPRDTLAALYRASKVGLVTPLRDGMNLVAKEYVAAQDPADPGMLVLSRFTGAAEEMKEAIIVNPFNIDEVANAMQTALTMPLPERRARHAKMLARIRMFDAEHWQFDFLQALSEADGEGDGQPRRLGPASAAAPQAPGPAAGAPER